jgi:hypothetical protein
LQAEAWLAWLAQWWRGRRRNKLSPQLVWLETVTWWLSKPQRNHKHKLIDAIELLPPRVDKQGSSVPTVWPTVGTGDFDGDGESNIVLRDTSGNVAIRFMVAEHVGRSAGVGNVSTVWSIQGANAD